MKDFLEELEDVTITAKEDETRKPVSKKYDQGVKDTIKMARVWFESMGIKKLKINPNDDEF